MQSLTHTKEIAIAPMMGITDKHFRYFFRQISTHVTLYTEMIVADALLHDKAEKLLDYHTTEEPVVIQLGGSCPKTLAKATSIIDNTGYNAINLNVGCPSDRVQAGEFGACLMTSPELVAECIHAMRNQTNLPITVKTRLGVDEHDNYEFIHQFIQIVSAAGCDTFIIHARKAWLNGLNPKQNRTLPPLNYERVYQLQEDFPHLHFILNGGLKSLHDINTHTHALHGTMIGRLAHEQPLLFKDIDEWFTQKKSVVNVHTILNAYAPYYEQAKRAGHKPSFILRPLINLFHGFPGAKKWRTNVTQATDFKLLLATANQLLTPTMGV